MQITFVFCVADFTLTKRTSLLLAFYVIFIVVLSILIMTFKISVSVIFNVVAVCTTVSVCISRVHVL